MTTLRRRLVLAIAASATSARAWRALLTLLIIAVSYLALSPRVPPGIDFGWDKLNHVLAFTALAFSACLGSQASRGMRLLLLGGLLAFGGLIEVLQLFVPGRTSEWGDLLADSIGIGCGAVIAATALWAVSGLSRRSR
jgi:VanZ family protein